MKIVCEILSVESEFPNLRLKLQGQQPSAAEWRGTAKQEMLIPLTDATQRAFYVGRVVELIVKPR